jgi:peptidoglycan/xylan/chitin deacetylase (PgdA/CDA1 family)
MSNKGFFIISLDFELFWGVRDKRKIKDYKENILGVRTVIPRLLEIFNKYDIRATFAVVGFLFAKNKEELIACSPEMLPDYVNPRLSPYGDYMKTVGESADTDPFHYGPDMIDLIRKYPQHEIATHTYSHYYCLEAGQTETEFRQDLSSAIMIGLKNNVEFRSIVFPRNQCNEDYLLICLENGIKSYRGETPAWFSATKKTMRLLFIKKAFRFIDSYLNISGHNTFDLEKISAKKPYNLPGSRFLYPSERKNTFSKIRVARIKKSMTYAAKRNVVYHLWWHPHNFGKNVDSNLKMIEEILNHYTFLHQKYNFTSLNMKGISEYIDEISDKQNLLK